jgi:hypothetical protein
VNAQLDPNDPVNWSRHTASWIIGADLGFMVDHCAMVTAGVWGMPQRVIGVVDIRQYPLGTAFEAFADDLVTQNRKFPGAKIVCDLTNNSAMAGIVSSRLGRNPGQHFIAAILTNAATHALEPQAMPVNVGSLRAAVPRWSLSKAELIETVAAELSGKTLRLTKTGDAEKLRSELEHLEREVRRSGSVSFAAAQGHHDDLVCALGLAVFGCRRFGSARPRNIRKPIGSGRMPASAWT